MNLNQIITISRYNHFHKLCVYGKCRCFIPVHDAIEEIQLKKTMRKRFV